MAAVHRDRIEAQRSSEARVLAPSKRSTESAGRRTTLGGPAFINDEAAEQHHLDLLRDPAVEQTSKGAARLDLARMYERRGQFAEAAEMYERNIWDGLRTPATYAGLAAAYREIGRHDLADAALEQVRRQGGADRSSEAPSRSARNGFTANRRTQALEAGTPTVAPMSRPARTSRGAAGAQRRRNSRSLASRDAAIVDDPLAQIHQSVAPFLAGQAGRRTLLASTVLLPMVLGLGIFAAVVLTSTRPRVTESAPAPTPAPVATVAPTPVPVAEPTLAIPAALAQPPASAKLVVSNVGADGLSLRRSPGVGERLKVWREGSEIADLGESSEHDGKTWKKVRDPDGNVGWMLGELLSDPAIRAAAPAAPKFASGGIGLTPIEWEQSHGKPTRTSVLYEYNGGDVLVGHLEGKVMHIERAWKGADAVSLEAARNEVRAYLTEDATLMHSADLGDGQIIDVYSSASLATRFGETAWNGGKVGTFSVKYRFRAANDRMVTSAMFRLGDGRF